MHVKESKQVMKKSLNKKNRVIKTDTKGRSKSQTSKAILMHLHLFHFVKLHNIVT